MVLCTVRRISPGAEQPAPKMPQQFVDKDKFDKPIKQD